ncbi:MAG: response regulator [Geobacter sp.]|nr:response regulator [Geobacter sp.]
MATQLGDILVETEIISKKTLEKALERQNGTEKRLGQVLEEMGVITEAELMEALLRQHSPFADIAQKKQLGDILVQAKLISSKTLERALERQRAEGKRLGEVLEEMGVITESELVDALGRQFGFKTVADFSNRVYPPALLNMLPTEFVMKRVIFPLKHKDMMLAVAITDPFDGETTDMIARITGLQVVPVIATRKEILEAIARHYLNAPVNPDAGDTILVVEDSPTVATVIQAALVKEGYNVITSKDGIEALKTTLTHRPQLVITDAQMPRLDGYGFLRAVKANPITASIPVIMLTGRASTDEEQKALDAGFFDFIPKPVQPLRVVSRVKRALELSKKIKN